MSGSRAPLHARRTPRSRILKLTAAGALALLLLVGTVVGSVALVGRDLPVAGPLSAPDALSVPAGSSDADRMSVLAPAMPPSVASLPDVEMAVDRADAVAAAVGFVKVINTYGPADLARNGTMARYRARVEQRLTADFRRSFRRSVVSVERRVASSGLTRTGTVGPAGVASLTASGAEVLVTGVVDTRTDAGRPTSFPLSFVITVHRRGEQWLVGALEILRDQEGPGVTGQPGQRIEPEVADARAVAVAAAPLLTRKDERTPADVVGDVHQITTDRYVRRLTRSLERRPPASTRRVTRGLPIAAGAALVTPERVEFVVVVRQRVTVADGAPTLVDQSVVVSLVPSDGAWLVDDLVRASSWSP